MAVKDSDICIVGGGGHVGLPIALAFTAVGQRVVIYDLNVTALETIETGSMPFVEHEAEPLLRSALDKKLLVLSSDPADVSKAHHVIIAIGTPVDEYLNPQLRALLDLFDTLRPHLDPSQTIIIRSTIFPRTCYQIQRQLAQDGSAWNVAYCPERIAQGKALRELRELPQIVSGSSPAAVDSATKLFSLIAPEIVHLDIEEAELAKLFSNAWRYIQFAAANEFYMLSANIDVDFNRVREAMVKGYGRAANLPSAGFAAGPCLLKDTMQLSALSSNHSRLGQAAMLVNEGLPGFIVENLRRRYDLSCTTVGILGMAFKADIDDSRDSLSYKLGKLLRFHGATVGYSDEFVKDDTFVTKEELVNQSQILIVGAPHTAYRTLEIPAHLDTVDVWGILPSKI